MARLVVCVLSVLVAVCLAAPSKVNPQDDKGGKSYNVAHFGHGSNTEGHPGGGDTDDGDGDYPSPGGGSYPGSGGGYYPRSNTHRTGRVRRHYEGDLHGYGGHRYGHRGYGSHGPYAYPLYAPQSHSYSKASASASSGSGGGHVG